MPQKLSVSLPSLCNSGITATAIETVDGDTIKVRLDNGTTESVRYIGINTPETGQRCASEATAYNNSLLNQKKVRLIRDVSDRDEYERLF